VPFARGGEATVGNIELRCRAHNAYEAERSFGSLVLRERPTEYNSVRTEFDIGTRSVPRSGSVPWSGTREMPWGAISAVHAPSSASCVP
jgi:hypothetical protein